MTPEEITDQIKKYLVAKGKVYPCHTNRASELGHPCLRYLAYTRVAWEHREPPDATLAIIFDDGNLHEEATFRLLKDSGFTITEQQKSFNWPEYQISGHIDGKILLGEEAVPVEVKSVSDYSYIAINSQADLFDPKRPWVTKWGGQLQLYLLMDNKDWGLLILKCKSPKGWFPIKVIRVDMDYELGEELLKKAEKINKVVAQWREAESYGESLELLEEYLPDRIEPDEAICKWCPFLHLCLGQREWGPELIILDDDEVLALLERREELEAFSKEYKAVDAKAKTAIKNRGENLIVGSFHATVKTNKAGQKRVNIERVVETVPA